MRNRNRLASFTKLTAALALLIAGLTLLSPCFTVVASLVPLQDPQKIEAPEGERVAPKKIEPSTVSVVNFRKLAEADARARKTRVANGDVTPSNIPAPAPMTAPEKDEPNAPATAPGTSAPQEQPGPLVVSPGPAASFQGEIDRARVGGGGFTIPPDTMGAVGPDKIFTNVNNNYVVQNKTTGATLSEVSINTFWASTGGTGVFDPRVVYDPYQNRWIVVAVSNGHSASSSVLVGVSATSDPQGTFTLFRYTVGCAAGAGGCDPDGEWADFPMLGFNKNWIAVGWNQFDNATPSNGVNGRVMAIDYPSLRAGTSNAHTFTVTTAANFCMNPAETFSSTEETLYIPAHQSSASALYRLHKLTGTPGAPVLTTDPSSHVRTGGAWSVVDGDLLPQNCTGTCPATLRKLDAGDVFLRSNSVFRNGSIWYAQTVGLPAGTLTHTGVQWTRISTTGAFIDGARLEDPAATATNGGEWYAYPSITVNANNDVLLGFGSFASNHFARAAYAFRAGTDAAGTMRDPVVSKEGEDYYAKTFGGTRNRWGDYSHSVVDPTNDKDMWTLQEYARPRTFQNTDEVTDNSRWGTWWAKVADIGGPPPSPTPTPSPQPSPVPPANDNFANAQPIHGCSGTLNATNANATKESGEPTDDPSGSSDGGASIWYSWQAPASTSVTITTIGSNFDTMLGVYTGSAVNGLTIIARNDDIVLGSNVQSSVTFTATAGTVYKISVDGFDADVGNIVLNWNQSGCSVNTQFSSSNFSVNEGGGSATVTVTRTGNTAGTSTVDYRTTDTDNFTVNCANKSGNAFARCDFATVVGTLSFAGGETSKNILVPIIDDSYAEGNETFGLTLSNSAGANLTAPTTTTVTINDNESVDGPNPMLQTNAAAVTLFVRQHYLDFLGREPEPGEPWSAILNGCSDQFNTNPASPATNCDRIFVSGSFFGSPEFKDKGFYIIGMYRVAFNRLPTYVEFSTDLASISGTTAAEVFAKRAAYANSFVGRPEFTGIYGAMTNTQLVNALMAGSLGQNYNLTSITTRDPASPDIGAKITLTSADLISRLTAGNMTKGQVLRAIAQSDEITLNKEAVNAFVASQYYGYLRRTPDTTGFNGWVTYLTANPNDFRTMVNGFLNSPEYRLRFGPL